MFMKRKKPFESQRLSLTLSELLQLVGGTVGGTMGGASLNPLVGSWMHVH